MSGLLKAAMVNGNVRSFGASSANPPDDPALAALDAAFEALDRANARIAELESQCLDARSEGERDGLKRGRAESSELQLMHLEELKSGIGVAQSVFAGSLASMDRLAASLAAASLEVIFGDPAHYPDLVERALCAQVEALDSSSIVRVSVSPQDFPDAEALADLASSSRTAVIADSALVRGECRITLQLGSIDIGPTTQWERIRGALGELAGAGA